MGVCYTLILLDDFDWGYSDTDKTKKMEELKKEYGGYCFDIVGQWYGGVVIEVDKNWPLTNERVALLKKYCDTAWYIADNALTSIIRI